MAGADNVRLENLGLPWVALYSDNVGDRDVRIKDERKYTVVTIDFQFTKREGRDLWVARSDSAQYRDRIIWVVGDIEAAGCEGALETCRRDRRVEPTVMSVKRSLNALRDGLTLLRRMETDLSDSAIAAMSEADNIRTHYWPSLEAVGCSAEAQAAAKALLAHLTTERPSEATADLLQHMELLRGEYRAVRRSVLSAHEEHLAQAIEGLKRRSGFDQLNADESHQVVRHLREGGFAATDERAIAPALEAPSGLLLAKRGNADQKALAALDTILESKGRSPVVEIALELGGREIADEATLERLLCELRAKILRELQAHHRVRLRP